MGGVQDRSQMREELQEVTSPALSQEVFHQGPDFAAISVVLGSLRRGVLPFPTVRVESESTME